MPEVHHSTDILGTDKTNPGNVISDGRCCDLESFLKTRLSGKPL